ncbi:MAG: M48 family metallopeptidase [Pseudomonadota bacterium]
MFKLTFRKMIGVSVLSFSISSCDSLNLDLASSAAIDAYQAATLSNDQIRTLSKQAVAEQDKNNQLAPASNAYQQRLQRLVANLKSENGVPLNFKVYLKDEMNAFALADGSVRVYSGLMDELNDDELLFVIGHEVGHVVHGHSKKAAQVAYSVSAARKGVAAFGGVSGQIAQSAIGDFSQGVISAQFSQNEEKQADDYGVSYLQKNGRNPQTAVTALRKLGNEGGGLLSSHPNPQDRAARIAKTL